MKRSELLHKLLDALRKRNPLLVEQYLRPGLSPKGLERLAQKTIGLSEPLKDLYSWRDGTKFVHLSPGETYKSGMKKIEFIPDSSFHFVELKLAILSMNTWAEAAGRRPELAEGSNKYLPCFYNGATAYFMVDLSPQMGNRILYFESQSHSPFEVAYPSLDEFLIEILKSNETGEPLSFFRGR